MGEHPAAESLQWIAKVQRLVAVRLQKLYQDGDGSRKETVTGIIGESLGVSRAKVAPRRIAGKSALRTRLARGIRGDGNHFFYARLLYV